MSENSTIKDELKIDNGWGEWKECKLMDFIEINMGQSPKSEFYNNSGEGMPFLQGNRTFGFKYPHIDTFCTDVKKIAEKYSVLFSVRAPVGDINIANQKICIGRGLASLTAKNKENIYLFYLLKFLNKVILCSESGTVFGSINKNDLGNIDINLPPLPEQKAIAEVLSSLDDKIDLLHRQNKTLEQMAETLFRQWFVEEANEDWEEKPLSAIATFLNGLACQKYPPKNDIDKLPVLKIKQLRNGFSDDCDWCTTDVRSEYYIQNGDVIFSWSASLMVKIWNGDICILNQHLFKVSSEEFPKWYYYLWSKHYLEEFISISASHATTMGHIKRNDLDEVMVLVPSNDELKSMTEKNQPLVDKQIKNSTQIRTLEKTRDTLLSNLMSGEVNVFEYEKRLKKI